MGQTWEGESHSIKWVTLIKIVVVGSASHTAQNGSHLAKWVKLWDGESHSIKWVTLIKIVAVGSTSHTAQNGSHWAKWVKLREGESHLINMGHIYQNWRNWKYE